MEIKLCENIRALRQERGINQEVLADALSVSIQAVSKWETGASLPDVVMVPKIAAYFGVSTDYLFFGVESASASAPIPEPEPRAGREALFPDDGKLRVVQYIGSSLIESVQQPEAPVSLRLDRMPIFPGCRLAVEILGSAQIEGSVNGTLHAGGDVTCRSVNGTASAGGDMNCGSVNGFAAGQKRQGWGFNLNFGGFGKSQKDLDLPFPDDGKLRVVQFIGSSLVTHSEFDSNQPIPLEIEMASEQVKKTPLAVDIWGSAAISGDVLGNVSAGDSLSCGNVGGNASAGDSLTCTVVNGNVKAGDGVDCGDVGGSVVAGDGVNCNGVGGSVTAEDEVNCTEVHGNVTAEGDINCLNVGGNAVCEGSLECGDIGGDVKSCEGDIRCAAIKGNVRCEGNIHYQ